MLLLFFVFSIPPPPRSSLFPYTTLFRSGSPGRIRSRRGAHRQSPRTGTAQPPCQRGSQKRLSLQNVRRSEEHTSELQSRPHLVCRLLLEKKNTDSGPEPR